MIDREDIIRMALEAGLITSYGGRETVSDDLLKRFAALVAAAATEEANRRANASWAHMCEKMVAAEREACAKVCDEADDPLNDPYQNALARELAEAIRARGKLK